MTRFVWFWTFWHWSKESSRRGVLLRGPLPGIGGHWDEWYRHEASSDDREIIEALARNESGQRQFIVWLIRSWAVEEGFGKSRALSRFVLNQLSNYAPFKKWAALEKYRTGYSVGGISAIVLTQNSLGESDDVRTIEAVAVPADRTGVSLVTEGFQTDSSEIEIPRRAVLSVLRGRGLAFLLAHWAVAGRRPYPKSLRWALGSAWLALAGAMIYLRFGPDPGARLRMACAGLAALWAGLVLTEFAVIGAQSLLAWLSGKRLSDRLEASQIRLRMAGGFTLKGGSAGLPFCLNILNAIHRSSNPRDCPSWIWRSFFARARRQSEGWAATGVVTPHGFLKPVVIEPKLRACLNHDSVKHILTPRQPGANRRMIEFLIDALQWRRRAKESVGANELEGPQLRFAAEELRLGLHPCRSLAHAMMTFGRLTSRWQIAFNAIALGVSVAMFLALPDLRGILAPPSAPVAVAPASPSPEYLWVSLDTRHPKSFRVILESGYWANRRADVAAYDDANAPARAEIRLQPLTNPTANEPGDAVVWVERHNQFLGRDFGYGERVGRYSIAYLRSLGYE